MLAAQFYGRKDVSELRFLDIVAWAEAKLAADATLSTGTKTFLAAGVLHFLCIFVKAATRQNLSAAIFSKLYNLSSLFQSGSAVSDDVDTKSPLIRRLVAKFHGRLASGYLPPSSGVPHARRATQQPTALMGIPAAVSRQLDDADFSVPEEVEVLVGDLLEMLSDRDSRVRWTVSKAIARISAQLPLAFVDQIVLALLQMYPANVLHPNTDTEDLSLVSAATWHGTTLCLASLLRNTLLTPAQVQECLPWILRALIFSQRKGAQKIGSNIRDAGCYFVWCAARATSKQPDLLSEPDVQSIAAKLVVVACTDEEVSVRRAASAAYQECVGRLPTVPDGLEVLVLMDAINVGGRRAAFLEAATAISRFMTYRAALCQHMQSVTLRHADVQMRQLAALSLGCILNGSDEQLQAAGDQAMAGLSISTQVAHVHGQLLLLEQVAARTERSQMREQIFRSLADLPQNLLSGASVIILLPTVANVMTEVLKPGTADRHQTVDHRASWKRFADAALKRPEASSHDAAAQIVAAVSARFDCLADLKATLRTLKLGNSILGQQCVTRMLGSFDFSPQSSCHELLDIVVDRLSKLLDLKNSPTFKSMAAKRNALDSLGRLGARHPSDEKLKLEAIVQLLQAGLEDYTFDERGDVSNACLRRYHVLTLWQIGSCIRMTCMECLTEICLVRKDPEQLLSLTLVLFKQSCERLDNVRDVAGQQLCKLREAGTINFPAIPEGWRNLSTALPFVLHILPTLSNPLVPLSGVVTVAGSPPEITLSGRDMVLQWTAAQSASKGNTFDIVGHLLQVLELRGQSNRVIIPTLHLLACLREDSTTQSSEHIVELVAIAKASLRASRIRGRTLAAARL